MHGDLRTTEVKYGWWNPTLMFVISGKIVSFQPVVYYNDMYLTLIGLVAFITQLQLLHILRYHKTISIYPIPPL